MLATYTEQLIREGVINAEKAANLSDEVMAELREKLEASRSYQGKKSECVTFLALVRMPYVYNT